MKSSARVRIDEATTVRVGRALGADEPDGVRRSVRAGYTLVLFTQTCSAIALLLGHAVLFFFDWIFSCLAFYSTETWGLSVVRVAVATFFSGSLVPLQMLPDWLRGIATALPFAQSVAVPVSLLSGITPLGDAPGVWAIQGLWLIGLLIVSRIVFNVSVRKITVQGG